MAGCDFGEVRLRGLKFPDGGAGLSRPYLQLYFHLVWATWDRLPLITPVVEPRIYHSISEKCLALGCTVIALNGYLDHVHLLVKMPATLAVAALVKEVKGVSSHLMTHEIAPDVFFKWQSAYGAFTVHQGGLDRLVAYIRNQKTPHAENKLVESWEKTTEE